jgi:magnesium transporter
MPADRPPEPLGQNGQTMPAPASRPPRAGRLDDPIAGYIRRDVTTLGADDTVDQALASLRARPLGERIVYFYVVEAEGVLAGVLPVRRLLSAEPAARIRNLMVKNVVTLRHSATIRDASDLFVRHRLLAVPVLDHQAHLEGVVDVTLLADEATVLDGRQTSDDIFQMIGARVSESATAWQSFSDRFPWLLCNVGGGMVAAFVTGHYQALLRTAIGLALFVPVVLALAESVGIQSVTLTLQALHRRGRRLTRDIATAMLLGAGCALVVAGLVVGFGQPPAIAWTVALTIFLAMAVATLVGVGLPAMVGRTRRDPRIASGPIVLATVDFVALIIYFNLARLLL